MWSIPTAGFPEAHFAVMPPTIAERCILAGCRAGGVVLDPFCGSGTTGMMAPKHGRRFVGIDLFARYLDLALRTRLAQTSLLDPVSPARDETLPEPSEVRDETRNEDAPGCAFCSRPVAVAATGRPRAYCSRACQQAAYRAWTAAPTHRGDLPESHATAS